MCLSSFVILRQTDRQTDMWEWVGGRVAGREGGERGKRQTGRQTLTDRTAYIDCERQTLKRKRGRQTDKH